MFFPIKTNLLCLSSSGCHCFVYLLSSSVWIAWTTSFSSLLAIFKIPFGYKANLWKIKDPLPHTAWIKRPDQIGTNPTEILGSRKNYSEEMFFNFSKKMIDKGATIIGGCCEIKPKHIKKVSELLN